MINDIDHTFLYLLTVCMSSLEKCLFRALAHFFNWVVCFSIRLYMSFFKNMLWIVIQLYSNMGFPGGVVVKNLPARAGDARDMGSIPGSEKSPGGGNDNPLQYSCLGNSMDRGGWWATVHGVAKSWTWLSDCTHTPNVHIYNMNYL